MIGIYFLIYKRQIIYIGKSRKLGIRIGQHSDKKFDCIRLIECDSQKLDEYERRLIMKFKPSMNVAFNGEILKQDFDSAIYKETRGRKRKYNFDLKINDQMLLPKNASGSVFKFAKENRQKFKTWVENGVLHIIRIK